MLTFLCSDSGQDDKYYLRLGLLSAAKACGFNFHIYDERVTPIFDAISDFKPDVILSTYSNHTLAQRKAIEKHNLKFYSLDAVQYGFDSVNFKAGKFQSYLECDVARVGPPIKDLFNYLPGDLKYRFFGPASYSCPEYMGKVDLEDQADIFASAKVSITANLEEYFWVLGSGGVALHVGEMGSLAYYFLNAKTLNEIHKLLAYISEGLIDLEEYKALIKDYVFGGNTYTHRLADILFSLDFTGEGEEVISHVS